MTTDAEIREHDAAARIRAQREFRAPLVMQAGAGTGKTAALTARVVAWSLGEGWERAEGRVARGEGILPPSRPAASAPSGAGAERIEAEAQRELVARDVLGRIAAITFTEAAAAEMAERIEGALSEVEHGDIPDWIDADSLPPAEGRAERARALREALDHLTVRTIHAWCRSLLARFPLAAKLPPDFEVDASGRIQAEAMQRVLTEQLREEYSRDEGGPLLDLAADECGPTSVYDSAILLVGEGVRSHELEGDPLPADGVRDLLRAFRLESERLSACEPPVLKGAPAAVEVFELLGDSRALITDFESEERVDPWALDRLCRDIDALWEKRGADLSKWSKGKGPKKLAKHCGEDELRAAAGAFRTQLDSLRGLYPARLIAARRALARVLAAFEAEMASRGAVTFADLLRGARDLLMLNPSIAAQLRAELDQLLVDEFQDTDALQCDLVRTIALEGEEPPGLFVVGDPKQSIYGWRSADLEAFEGFVEAIRASGGEVLELSVNFRSVPAVLEEVERCIEPVMHEQAAVQPRFQKLVSSTANATAPGFSGVDSEGASWAPIEHWVSWVESDDKRARRHTTKAGLAASIEARAFAEDVHRLREERGVDLSTVALLLRSRGDLDRYLRALRKRGVPYVVTGERSYYGRREVVDAISLLRCVLDPNDHIALVGMLRSPTVGVPDAALIPLWSRNFPQLVGQLRGGLRVGDVDGETGDADGFNEIETALREVVDAMPEVVGLERIEGWETSALAALRILGRLRESFETEAPDRFVERLRTEFAAEISEAGRFPAAFRLANLERFYRDLASDLAAGADEQALVRRLKSSAAHERDADEPVAIVEGAVQVMTIHGAKGLGFDHVYVAQSHKGSGGSGGSSDGIERVGDRVEFHLLGTDSLGYGAAKSRRAVREAAERVRTLYVALTRAKSRLVVMGTWPKRGEPKLPEDARSYAQLVDLRPGVPDLEEAIEGGNSRFEHGDALWRFPWFEPDVGGARGAEAPRIDWPNLEAVARQSAELANKQVEAQVRMMRPLRVAASRLTHGEARNTRAEAEFGAEAGEDVAAASPSADGVGRDVAMRIGTVVHALLEEWDFEVAPDEELDRARERIGSVLARVGLGGDSAALEEAASILAGFAESPLFERFALLGDDVLARELPVLLPREEGDDALQGTVGAIDLVYRDAAGSIVVVDYKTDRIEDEADLVARSAAYAAQGRVYARAVREGLGLVEEPRFELWFLREGRVAAPLEA